MFPYASNYFSGYIYGLCTLGIIYASICTCRQFDLKKIIAYSSVAHMNFVVIGIFALNHEGLEGSLFLMLGHGIISGGLFFLVGIVYDRHDTRCVDYYGGLAIPMPLYTTLFLFFTLANMSFPGSCNFVGEIMILVGLFKKNIILAFFAATGIILSASYSI
jgi:NADH-quinone oxidoreductase subunit M